MTTAQVRRWTQSQNLSEWSPPGSGRLATPRLRSIRSAPSSSAHRPNADIHNTEQSCAQYQRPPLSSRLLLGSQLSALVGPGNQALGSLNNCQNQVRRSQSTSYCQCLKRFFRARTSPIPRAAGRFRWKPRTRRSSAIRSDSDSTILLLPLSVVMQLSSFASTIVYRHSDGADIL